MGISVFSWTKFCTHSKEGSEILFFMEKLEFEPEIFHKLTSSVHEVYFSHYVPYLVRHKVFFFFSKSKAMENGKLYINLYINKFEQTV